MSTSDPDETYLTVAEVAETLKLNQQTVRNWIDQGSLPALRVGRRVRIKRSDFERILEQSYSGGTNSSAAASGPSADDFWGGEPVGRAEPPDAVSRPALPDAGGERRFEPSQTPAAGGSGRSGGSGGRITVGTVPGHTPQADPPHRSGR
jgi:excisionase family DNA binding protein